MDTTTIIVILAVVVLLGLFLFNRNRPARRGTYDDKNTRSSGSIGGGARAHDDAEVRSSGSIGGGTRGNNSPQHSSGGSIGGGPVSRPPREDTPVARPQSNTPANTREDLDRVDRDTRDLDEPIRDNGVRTLPDLNISGDRPTRDLNNNDDDHLASERAARQRKDNEDFKSGGSFGGSAR